MVREIGYFTNVPILDIHTSIANLYHKGNAEYTCLPFQILFSEDLHTHTLTHTHALFHFLVAFKIPQTISGVKIQYKMVSLQIVPSYAYMQYIIFCIHKIRIHSYIYIYVYSPLLFYLYIYEIQFIIICILTRYTYIYTSTPQYMRIEKNPLSLPLSNTRTFSYFRLYIIIFSYFSLVFFHNH